jgi:hypothetical protein
MQTHGSISAKINCRNDAAQNYTCTRYYMDTPINLGRREFYIYHQTNINSTHIVANRLSKQNGGQLSSSKHAKEKFIWQC